MTRENFREEKIAEGFFLCLLLGKAMRETFYWLNTSHYLVQEGHKFMVKNTGFPDS